MGVGVRATRAVVGTGEICRTETGNVLAIPSNAKIKRKKRRFGTAMIVRRWRCGTMAWEIEFAVRERRI